MTNDMTTTYMTKRIQNIRTTILRSLMVVAMILCGVGENLNAQEITLSEQTYFVTGWKDQPYVLSNGGAELKKAGAAVGDIVAFYVSGDEGWQLQIIEGHWGPQWAQFSAADLDGTGAVCLELTQEILDAIYNPQQNWDGGTFVFNGDGNITCSKITLRKVKQYNITVTQPNQNGTITSSATKAPEGRTITLTAYPQDGYKVDAWSIKDVSNHDITSYVNLNTNGNIATFKMPASDVTVTATFTLKSNPTSMTVSPENINLNVGYTGNITVTLSPDDCYNNIKYKSNNTSVATVSAEGVVTGVAYGTTTITVEASKNDGTTTAFTGTVNVSVRNKVSTPVITFEPKADDKNKATATITCSTIGASIFYTVNGGEPTVSSNAYTAPFEVNDYDVVKAVAVKTNDTSYDNSDMATARNANIVYLNLKGGDDGNDGKTASTAKRTWAGAYDMLKYGPNAEYLKGQWEKNNLTSLSEHAKIKDVTDFTGSVDNNIIYLVGDVSLTDFSDLFTIAGTDNSHTGNSYSTCMNEIVTSGCMKPATISGKYATSNNYSTVELPISTNLILNEDTRFEYIKFHQGDNGNNDESQFLCAYYDFEFGDGMQVENIISTATFNKYDHGYISDENYRTQVPHILVYGGYVNDARFTNMPGKELNFDKFLPHPDGYKITLHSGYLSTISPGGKQWEGSINGAMGSPNKPIKCTITIDVDHAWNKDHENGVLRPGTNCTSTVPNNDVSAIIAGTHQGNMYGDVEIIVKSGRVGRIVNGNLGANQECASGYPVDSYFGRAKILIDPREPSAAEKAIGYETKNSMVEIQELYGGGLGRFKSDFDSSDPSSTYFYGYSSVIINGGTFKTALYAAGAGGVNGIGDADADHHHTNDDKVPYLNGSTINYGACSNYANHKVFVSCSNPTESVDLSLTNTDIEIHGGIFGSSDSPIDGIFGGGYGWVHTGLIDYTANHKPNSLAGSMFANAGNLVSKVTIDGDAEIYGNIYGAGRGTDVYYKNFSTSYTTLGLVSGNVQLTIGGNAKIHGDVYGAGKGIDDANLPDMAHLYGNTTLTIKENAEITETIYGGGANGATEGTTEVNIEGGTVTGGVYGGGALANTGDATVNLTGGIVSGDVYGGGLGRTTDRAVAATVGTATVNVGSADGASVITGSVYGCNNLNGYPTGVATVNINNTAAKGTETSENPYHLSTAFGGGNLASCSSNTIVNMNGGSVNVIYGGGSLANTGNTTVNLMGGTVGDVYGGGLGSASVAAEVDSTTVNIGSGTVSADASDHGAKNTAGTCKIAGSVFGCNNLNGTPTGDATVNVFKTNAQSGAADGAYHVYAVYGGGNKAAYDPEHSKGISCTKATHVNIYTCNNSIQYVYGGGNAASVPATNLTIWGGKFDYVFGGGNGKTEEGQPTNPGANVGYYTDPDINVKTTPGAEYGLGEANTSIHDGIINHLFGGSNTRGNIRKSSITKLEHEGCDFTIGEVYAAGNEAYQNGTAILNIGCIPGLGVLYGGARKANINNDIQLTIKGGTYGQIFGGNNESGNIKGSIKINIEETGCNPIVIGEVYGGGNLAPYTTPEGKDGPTVNAYSFTKIGAIYGGGYGETAVVKGNTTVNVQQVAGKHATSIDANGDGSADNNASALGIVGTIYGGGNAAKVDGNTYVNVGTAKQVTFLSSDADDSSWSASKTVLGANIQPVTVTIPENITGGDKAQTYTGTGNVFGGGNNAEVTGKTNVVIGADKE